MSRRRKSRNRSRKCLFLHEAAGESNSRTPVWKFGVTNPESGRSRGFTVRKHCQRTFCTRSYRAESNGWIYQTEKYHETGSRVRKQPFQNSGLHCCFFFERAGEEDDDEASFIMSQRPYTYEELRTELQIKFTQGHVFRLDTSSSINLAAAPSQRSLTTPSQAVIL